MLLTDVASVSNFGMNVLASVYLIASCVIRSPECIFVCISDFVCRAAERAYLRLTDI